jgi:hypothetical protein
VYSVAASSWQSPVSAILDNNFSQPLSTRGGSADSDSQSYAPHACRMIQYPAPVGLVSIHGVVVGDPAFRALSSVPT